MTRTIFHPVVAGLVLTSLLGVGVIGGGFGCAAAPGARLPEDAPPDTTTGVDLEFFRTGEDRMFARFRVERDGTIRFGGGADAVAGRYSWSGRLTGDEIDRLATLIRQNRWAETDPPSSGRPADRSSTITLRMPGRRRSFTVLGEEPGVDAVYALLDTAARRRHGEFLDALPRPGAQR